jgi:hypothetical protein
MTVFEDLRRLHVQVHKQSAAGKDSPKFKTAESSMLL